MLACLLNSTSYCRFYYFCSSFLDLDLWCWMAYPVRNLFWIPNSGPLGVLFHFEGQMVMWAPFISWKPFFLLLHLNYVPVSYLLNAGHRLRYLIALYKKLMNLYLYPCMVHLSQCILKLILVYKTRRVLIGLWYDQITCPQHSIPLTMWQQSTQSPFFSLKWSEVKWSRLVVSDCLWPHGL